MDMTNSSRRVFAVTTAVWGIVFAAVHFYWAAGGGAGMDGGTPTLAEALYIAFIAVLGLVGAAVAHGLYRPWGARVGQRRLRIAARLGGVVLLLGVAFGVGRWLAGGSLDGDGAAGVAITAYFLLGGVLFSALGWQGAARDRSLVHGRRSLATRG
jgi:hypothetical protein